MKPRAHAKLVTIVAASEMHDRVKRDLVRLGASSHSLWHVEGRGHYGPRSRDAFDAGNVRFETIVGEAAAQSILDYVAEHGESEPIIAFVQEVEAVPRSRFEA
jgi:nitrogen regulatory protein PII